MSQLRHAGLGFPNGPTEAWDLYLQDGRPLLMLESEYKWHADRALEGGRTVLFRAMPGTPSSFGWSVSRYAERVMATVPSNATDLVFACEGNLNYERGDNDDDWDASAWPRRYANWAVFMAAVANRIRGMYGWGGRIHWPPWSPGHGIRETLDVWRDSVAAFDIVDFHAYEDAATIEDEYRWFRATFPDQPAWLTEWNAQGGNDVDEDRRVLETLARLAAEDPPFHAFYFIGRWFQYPGMHNWTGALDAEGNADRLALFRDPPLAAIPGHEAELGDPPAVDPVLPDPEPVPPHQEDTVPELPRGVDVASYQGNPDWYAVAASGVAFAWTKATESTTYRNPTFARNWAVIKAAGLVRGAYHFCQPDSSAGPEAEADFFLDTIDAAGSLEPGDLLALDIEAGNGNLGDWALTWLQHVEQRVGFKPLVYTGAWFSEPHGFGAVPELGKYGLWLASYQDSMPAPPAPWSSVAIWQYTDAAQVPGIAGGVDGDYFNGPLERLTLYGKPPGPIPDPQPSPPDPPADDKQATIDGLVVAISDISDRIGNALAAPTLSKKKRLALVAEMRTIRAQFIGPRP